ncbi:hypothetical protein GH714_001407 [Hevea brasiliensis]|uniref:protein disulfide-isomerase n=1 Tax=Hevea brasiliensis TaxID=3981 RepID=A0A6A6L9K1_HEVBR|nr:hypothetical protein GH714_001407 [Hevea brasiliensis]
MTAISAGESEEKEKEFVLTLDHSNFTDIVSKHDFIVVEFYAPWCGHCKKLAPEYEKAASILHGHDPPVVLAKIDANEEANKDLATQYDIKGFPTLKILRNGGKTIQEYKGPREADGIVGVFPKFSGQEFENFLAVADKLRSDYEFGHTLDAKHLPRGESSVTGPLVRLFKPFDELFVDFRDFNVDALEKFVEESSMPIVTLFNSDASNHPFVVKFFNSPDAKAMLFTNLSSEDADSFKTKYHEAALQFKGQGIIFLLGDLEASQGAFQYFGLKEDQVPLIIIQTNDGQKYLKQNLEPDHITPWVTEYKEGKVLPYKKSEPVPEVNNEPVKVVVADSLQDIVINSGKNVLLEFYAPWCGHCKKLAPILDEVAISYQSDPDVVIAKLDATANDIPNDTFDVKGYPTVYFRSASGQLVQYEGDRTKEDIIDFIEKNRDKDEVAHEDKDKVAQEDKDKVAQEEPAKAKDEL